jgi:hypothetical protein
MKNNRSLTMVNTLIIRPEWNKVALFVLKQVTTVPDCAWFEDFS